MACVANTHVTDLLLAIVPKCHRKLKLIMCYCWFSCIQPAISPEVLVKSVLILICVLLYIRLHTNLQILHPYCFSPVDLHVLEMIVIDGYRWSHFTIHGTSTYSFTRKTVGRFKVIKNLWKIQFQRQQFQQESTLGPLHCESWTLLTDNRKNNLNTKKCSIK